MREGAEAVLDGGGSLLALVASKRERRGERGDSRVVEGQEREQLGFGMMRSDGVGGGRWMRNPIVSPSS